MKVLVADDERIIRKAIIHVINWAALGITHVLEARNGREALAEYDRLFRCVLSALGGEKRGGGLYPEARGPGGAACSAGKVRKPGAGAGALPVLPLGV